MLGFEASIHDIARTVFSSVLGLDVEPADPFRLAPVHQPTLAGVVQISGAWEGTVALQASTAFARQAAVAMLALDPGAVTVEDQRDTLGELANIVGGNFKALLPEPCFLSLPVVVEGADYELRLPGTAQLLQVALRVAGEPVNVLVFHRVLSSDPAEPVAI